jgi:hypothetical protein
MHRNVGLYDAHARTIPKKRSDYDRSRTKTSFSTFQQVWKPTNHLLALCIGGITEHVGHFLTLKIMRVVPLGVDTFTPLESNDEETTKEYHHVSSYNNLDRGEINSEPLAVIAADDPVTCAICAKDNDLLAPEGWKRFKLLFRFWVPVYYELDDSTFPSESREKLGRFVGIAEHVGHFMTFEILTDDTNKVIFRSNDVARLH